MKIHDFAKRAFIWAFVALSLIGPATAAFTIFSTYTTGAVGYQGVLDQNTVGQTWGFSNYALTKSYADGGGKFAIIERDSDSTTQTIGFDASYKADVSAFNSFCANTNCYASTIYDQTGNGNNATQATLANMPRVNVATDGRLQVCPAPNSTMSVAYNSVFATAKQELFAVANLYTQDYQFWQSGLPENKFTANITSGSTAMTNMSTQNGINLATGSGSGQPGLIDVTSVSSLWWQTSLTALPTGTTGTIQTGWLPLATRTGDTFSEENAVVGGVLLMAGPASSTFQSSAYWAMSIAPNGVDTVPSDLDTVRNASMDTFENTVGEGMRAGLHVYDWPTYDRTIYFDGTQVHQAETATNITYSTNVGLTLFSNASGSQSLQNSCVEQMLLTNGSASSRTAVSSWLMSQFSITSLLASNYATADGFTMTPIFLPNNPQYPNAYGPVYFTDAKGIQWAPQSPGYLHPEGPSEACANNINNGATMCRFVIYPSDSDVNITGAQRAEMGSSATLANPSGYAEKSYQYEFESLPNIVSGSTGNWCYASQTVRAIPGGSAPVDFADTKCTDGVLRTEVVGVPCGSPITVVPGTVYAEYEQITNSNGAGTDHIKMWLSANGSALTLQCDVSGNLMPSGVGGLYIKQGVYTGDRWNEQGGVYPPVPLVYRQISTCQSTTVGACDITSTQPALPTHP